MKKNVETIKQEIKQEVDRQYTLEGYMPDGFGDNMHQYKLSLLADMYEKEEEAGNIPKDREKAFALIAKEYEALSSWS